MEPDSTPTSTPDKPSLNSMQTLTYRQARAHAQQCGKDVSRYQAVPCRLMNRWRILAHDVLHPETQDPIAKAGMWISPAECLRMAESTGVDYILVQN